MHPLTSGNGRLGVAAQLIDIPDVQGEDRDRISITQGEDLRTSVWSIFSFGSTVAEFCTNFASANPTLLASGLSDLESSNNDSGNRPGGPPNQAVRGHRAHGILERPNGDAAVFSGFLIISDAVVTTQISLY